MYVCSVKYGSGLQSGYSFCIVPSLSLGGCKSWENVPGVTEPLLLTPQLFISTLAARLNHTDVETCKSGNFHGALGGTGQHAWKTLLVVCMCESHVAPQREEVCRPCVNEKNVLSCLQGIVFMHFSFFVCVCLFQCYAFVSIGM